MIKLLLISNDPAVKDCVLEICQKPEYELVGELLGVNGLPKYLRKIEANIILMDLDALDGDFCNYTFFDKNLFREFIVIGFASDYKQAYYSLKCGFLDVRMKPSSVADIIDSISFCKNRFKNRSVILAISSSQDKHYLRVSDILYLKADNNNVDIYLKDGTILPVFNSLKHFQNRLSVPFMRIQRSYIINVTQVCRINRFKRFIMLRRSNVRIPFSEKYLDNMEHFENMIGRGSF